MSIYCVYVTFYRGNKLPPFYIGSSTIEKVNEGYRGSVRSKEFRKLWESEIKNNQHLFKTIIISTHKTRKLAIEKELYFHTTLNVVKSKMYVNKSKANVGGYFGMDVAGVNNPNYGKRWSKEKCDDTSNKLIERHKLIDLIWISNPETKKTKHIDKLVIESFLEKGWIEGRLYLKTENQVKRGKLICSERNSSKVCCLICQREFQSHLLSNHLEKHSIGHGIEFFGVYYTSLNELEDVTKCSRYIYQKYYKNGIDPTPFFNSRNNKKLQLI